MVEMKRILFLTDFSPEATCGVTIRARPREKFNGRLYSASCDCRSDKYALRDDQWRLPCAR